MKKQPASIQLITLLFSCRGEIIVPSKLRFENRKLVLTNSSEVTIRLQTREKGIIVPSKLRFENRKLVLTNSSELDLTYEFSIYS